jgi:hypothetical protein
MTIFRNGFIPTKSQGSPYVTKTFKVVATANNAYYNNDPVKLEGNTGLAERVTASSATLLGVVIASYKDNGDGNKRPLTFSQPTNGPFLTSGQAGFVEVITDPRVRYFAAIDTSASAGLIGKFFTVTAGIPNQRTGQSGFGLKALSATVANTSSRTFQVVEISDFEKAIYGRNTDLPADAGVVVKLANPLLS